MSNLTWTNALGGSWLDNADWDLGQVPGSGDWAFLTPFYSDGGAVIPYVVTVGGGAAATAFPLSIYGVPVGLPGPDGVRASSITVAISGGSSLTVPISTNFSQIGLGPQPANSGEFDLSGGSTLDLMLTTGPGIVVRFADDTANLLDLPDVAPGASLQPYDPGAFGGTVARFNTGDVIETGIAYRAADTLGYAGGVLTLTTLAAEIGPLGGAYQTTPGAVLRFAGPYRAGNFSLVDENGYDAIAFVPLTIKGGAQGRSPINGTPGDDTLIGYGGLNTIDGNGGSDGIQTGDGGYSTVNAGTPGDGQGAFSDTIALGGRANRVLGGDTNFTVTGNGGANAVTLGGGTDDVTLGGGANRITLGLGPDTVTARGGGNTVLLTAPALVQATPTYADMVTFGGTHNRLDVDTLRGGGSGYFGVGTLVVSGGSGYGVFNLQQSLTTLVTDGAFNTITIYNDGGETDTISPGSGQDTVNLLATPNTGLGDFVIHLAGIANVVQGIVGSAEIDGGAGRNTYVFDNPESEFSPAIVTVITDGWYNKFVLSSTNANTITAGSGWDTVSIADVPPDGNSGFAPVYQPSSVVLDGVCNTVTAGSGDTDVSGGTGSSTFVLGSGNDSVVTGGLLNRVTLGAGRQDSVTPGTGQDMVTLNGTDAAVMLQGASNMVFLNAGASGTISGPAPGLRVMVAGGIGQEAIEGLGSDPGAYIHLLANTGYASSAQVVAALVSDGNGGTLLPVGAGSIDLVGVSLKPSDAGLFGIG